VTLDERNRVDGEMDRPNPTGGAYAVKLTIPLNPLKLVKVSVEEAVWDVETTKFEGEADNVKSGVIDAA